jgi:hypothetical protein
LDGKEMVTMSVRRQVKRAVWTAEMVRELGLTTDVVTAGAILGIGRTKAYLLARAGTFPVPVVLIGERSYVVPTEPLLAFLGA